MKRRPVFLLVFVSLIVVIAWCGLYALQRWMEPAYPEGTEILEVRGATTFKDGKTGITFYVESDRRHVSAVDRSGRLLWRRDPFVEGKLQPYRIERPVIASIGRIPVERRKGRYLAIGFDSSQGGIMDFKRGDFTFLGQN
jgi:hypothetical protein